jgi:hypothetical protein
MIRQIAENGSSLHHAIRLAVAYADVFDYPLSEKEIHRYLPDVTADFPAVYEILRHGTDFLRCQDGFYTLFGREALVKIRIQREETARRLWPQALHYGKIIARIPFVRMVAITGALAMNNVENDADVDYFIVTEPGHVWLTRALVLMVGRFSSRRGVTLCPNYLVSLRAMVFPDKNLYAAHEVAQMIPLAGMDVYEEIREQNTWALDLLPNSAGIPTEPVHISQPIPYSISRPFLEAVMQTPPFRWLESWEMDRKIRKLRGEQSLSGESTFSADVCKGHMHRHQQRTDRALKERLRLIEKI